MNDEDKINAALRLEMEVNDHLNDLNIQLKEQISSLRERLKVSVHPKSLNVLRQMVIEQGEAIKILRESLIVAISMINLTRANEYRINNLKEVVHSHPFQYDNGSLDSST